MQGSSCFSSRFRVTLLLALVIQLKLILLHITAVLDFFGAVPGHGMFLCISYQ